MLLARCTDAIYYLEKNRNFMHFCTCSNKAIKMKCHITIKYNAQNNQRIFYVKSIFISTSYICKLLLNNCVKINLYHSIIRVMHNISNLQFCQCNRIIRNSDFLIILSNVYKSNISIFTFYVTKQNDSKSLTQILTFILN